MNKPFNVTPADLAAALAALLSNSIPLPATAAGSAGTSQKAARADHAHQLLDAFPLITLASRGGDPIASTSTAGSNIGLLWVPVPAVGNQDQLIFDCTSSLSVEGNAKYVKFYYCPTNNSLTSAVNFMGTSVASSASMRQACSLRGQASLTKQKFTNLTSSTGSTDLFDGAMDFGVAWYLGIAANITTAGSVALRDVTVQIQRGGA